MRPNSCSIQAPTWRVDRGKLAATQTFKLSSCAALIKPALPPISKLVRPSIPPCSKSLRQPRIVSSSSNNALATSRQLHPSSKSTRAFARRVIRLAAAPSRANAISLLRSSSPRKPPRIMPPSESDQQRNARNFPEPSMSRGIDENSDDRDQHAPNAALDKLARHARPDHFDATIIVAIPQRRLHRILSAGLLGEADEDVARRAEALQLNLADIEFPHRGADRAQVGGTRLRLDLDEGAAAEVDAEIQARCKK